MKEVNQGTMTFNSFTLKHFKNAYDRARREGHEEFSFDGQQYLVSYAKYLIEYLESRLS